MPKPMDEIQLLGSVLENILRPSFDKYPLTQTQNFSQLIFTPRVADLSSAEPCNGITQSDYVV